MKVLWITNGLYPDVCMHFGIETPFGGGWQVSAANSLVNTVSDIQLAIAAPYKGNDFKKLELNGIIYFLIPNNGSNKHKLSKLGFYWKVIHFHFLPDLVHIQGTEYSFLSSYINYFGSKNVVISIQGLVSVYANYYLGGIEKKVLLKNITMRDILRRDTLFSQKRDFMQRGEIEKAMIQSSVHVIGRTSWDKAHTWVINPKINYHFCNETLRDEFYQHTWELSNCDRHSIFLSQAHYPIKGLHQMIKAFSIILYHFPDSKIYVAGRDFVTNKGLLITGYGKYIKSLMKINGITNKIIFTGILQEKEICKIFLSSHVFVCPSSIENSPNSIGEAQLLGVPCVASYVGGISEMVKDNETGLLYRFEEVEMLAAAICKIFSDDQFAKNLSVQGQAIANNRHNKINNSNTLYTIYQSIYDKINRSSYYMP